MHKMATPNPQKTHNTPPSHNNDTTKKDHRRPSQQFIQPDSLQKCTNIDTIHKERIITTEKRTQMHKMATPNPQKTHNTPPSHNNDTIKKDHRRPKVNSYKRSSLQKCTQTIDTIHKERIITTGKRTQMHKMATPNPQKTHNTPPLTQ